ncbi:MAG: ATP-binding protein [Thermoplasmata archaeon]
MELVIASGKGGVGKSSIVASLTSILRDKKLAIVDADAEAPNLHILFKVQQWKEIREYRDKSVALIDFEKCSKCMKCTDVCVYNAIAVKESAPFIKEYLCEGCGACKIVCPARAIDISSNLFAGYIKIADTRYGPFVSAELDVGQHNSGKLVSEEKKIARSWIKDYALKNIIVDSAAGIGCQVIASMSGADRAILVAEPTESSLSDLSRVYTIAEHFKIKSYLVINKSDLNPGFKGLRNFAAENGIDIIGELPYDLAAARAIVQSVPVVELEQNSKISRSLFNLAEIVKGFMD